MDPPRIIEKDVHSYVLPIKSTLQQLAHPEILGFVSYSVENHDGIIRDIRDGSYFKQHVLFCTDRHALIILFYYDDLPMLFALHKYSMFYCTLGSLLPHLRSTSLAVNLYGIACTKHLKKYGVMKMLSSFI